MPAASTAQQNILDAASTLDRSFGIAYNRVAGRIFMYTLTRQASTDTKEFNGYYARANNTTGTNFAPFTGTAIFKGTYWQAAANDEYGNVVFGQKSEYNTTNNFPNCLLPLMSGGSNDQAADVKSNNMGTSTISIPKTVQVCGPDYPNRWWPSDIPSGSGATHILRVSGDIGASNIDGTPADRRSTDMDGGHVWFVPRGYTNKVFRVKLRYSANEQDNVGYNGCVLFTIPGSSVSLGDTPVNSAIGFGIGLNKFMLHDHTHHKIFVVPYTNPGSSEYQGETASKYAFKTTDTPIELTPPDNNTQFGWGCPTVFSLQGHNYLACAGGNSGSSTYVLYEINDDYTLTKVASETPLSGTNPKTNKAYKEDSSSFKGPAFSWIRTSEMVGRVYELAHNKGLYIFAIEMEALPTTACTYIGTYKQNGTSTPTLRRIITCNPPTGGEALSYTVYNSSNTSLNSGLLNVDARTYIDDNSSRCSSSSTYSYHTTGVYECDGRARTATETTSPAGPDAAAPAIPAPLTNTVGPTIYTYNYYTLEKNAEGAFSSSTTTTGSAGTNTGHAYINFNNGELVSDDFGGTAGTFNRHFTSASIAPMYSINGHNDLAQAVTWNYYGATGTVTNVPGVDSDSPKPTRQALTNSLQTTSTAVTQMNMPFSWSTPARSSKATLYNYEYTIKDSNGTVVASGNTTDNSVTIPDVVVGSTYTAEVRANYNCNMWGTTTGGYYSNVVSTSFIPNYIVQAPQIDVNIYKNNSGTVAVWDSEQGWINTTTPVYRIEVDLDEPSDTIPVSYYRLKVNKNDGNGFVYLSDEELRYFPAGSGNITPAQITSKTTVDATGENHTLYFYWDAYNRSHFPDDKDANTLSTKAYGPRTIYPAPDTNTPENWVFSLEAVYGADNANVTKSAVNEAFQKNPTVTSVEGVFGNGNAVKSVVYYNMQGIRLNRAPESGAYIKVSLFGDGTVRTEKLVAR